MPSRSTASQLLTLTAKDTRANPPLLLCIWLQVSSAGCHNRRVSPCRRWSSLPSSSRATLSERRQPSSHSCPVQVLSTHPCTRVIRSCPHLSTAADYEAHLLSGSGCRLLKCAIHAFSRLLSICMKSGSCGCIALLRCAATQFSELQQAFKALKPSVELVASHPSVRAALQVCCDLAREADSCFGQLAHSQTTLTPPVCV